VAAWVTDMFYNFYLLKNHKILSNLATTGARETIILFAKILTNFFDAHLTKFINNKILLNKINQ